MLRLNVSPKLRLKFRLLQGIPMPRPLIGAVSCVGMLSVPIKSPIPGKLKLTMAPHVEP